MQKIFVYRTVPQLRFYLHKTPKPQTSKAKRFTLSQKCLQTQHSLSSQKVLFKTRNNILKKDYHQKSQKQMNNKSILLSSSRPKTKQTHRKITLNEIGDIKFHQLATNEITWDKWKRPFSIVRNNKQIFNQKNNNMFETQRSQKRCVTQVNQLSRDEQEMQIAARQIKEKRIQRELGELNRLKKHINDKKQIVGLMGKIHEYQEKTMQKTFNSYREEVNEVVEFYKNQKLDPYRVKSRMETSGF